MRSYRRIATEEAFVTQEILTETQRVFDAGDVEPGFAKMAETILGEGRGARAIQQRLLDLGDQRISQMDSDEIDLVLLSITSPGVQVFEPSTAVALATEANDVLVEAIRRAPDRFSGLAAIAPQAPAAAARELERAKALGLPGFLINSHTFGEYLDAPKFAPIFEAAEALRMPLYLHPREPGPGMVAPYLDYGLYFATWGFAAECGLHVMRMILSGLLDRYPRLRIAIGHMGEGVPFWLQRIDNRYLLQVKIGAVKPLPRLPSEYFLDHFVVTTGGVTSGPALRHVMEVLGIDRIQFAGDYPYEDVRAGVEFIEGVGLTEPERRAIFETNAMRFWGIGEVAVEQVRASNHPAFS